MFVFIGNNKKVTRTLAQERGVNKGAGGLAEVFESVAVKTFKILTVTGTGKKKDKAGSREGEEKKSEESGEMWREKEGQG